MNDVSSRGDLRKDINVRWGVQFLSPITVIHPRAGICPRSCLGCRMTQPNCPLGRKNGGKTYSSSPSFRTLIKKYCNDLGFTVNSQQFIRYIGGNGDDRPRESNVGGPAASMLAVHNSFIRDPMMKHPVIQRELRERQRGGAAPREPGAYGWVLFMKSLFDGPWVRVGI